MKKSKIIFDKGSAKFVLKAFGVSENKDGLLIYDNSGEFVLCPEGEELTTETFGGIKKSDCGKPMFLKNDLLTTIKLHESQYQ